MTTTSPRTRSRTNGRAPAWFRGTMGALSRAAPPVAARVAERVFLTPPPRRVKPAEEGWAAGAQALTLEGPRGRTPVWLWGPGDLDSRARPTVLLAHGWGGRGPQLGAVAGPLVRRGYTVVAWDMPGHGERTEPTNLLEMARTTAEVGRRFGPPAGVVAHSFGTSATLAAAALHGLPVPRLAAVAPAAVLDSVARQFIRMTGFSEEVVARMRRRLAERLGFSWDELEAATIAPRLPGPVLVVHDRDDERVPFADGEELARLVPGGELVTTSGLGHSGPLFDPDVVARVMGFFPET